MSVVNSGEATIKRTQFSGNDQAHSWGFRRGVRIYLKVL